MFRVCHAFLSVHCSLEVICWEGANLLGLLYVMFYCVFVTFLCGVLGQVWYLIVSIPDFCLLTYDDSVLLLHFLGFKILNLNIFGVFWGVITKLDYI